MEFSAWRPPLYPAFLAVAYQFSRRLLFLFLLNVALAALSLYLFLRVGLILFGETAALIAGLVFALYPPLIMYSADFGTESLFLLILIAVFLVFYGSGKERSSRRMFALGVLVGLAALCRPNGLMLAPALVIAIWLTSGDWKQAGRKIAIVALASALVVLPWTYRNYRLFHRVVLISTGGGAAFWSGAHFKLEPGASLADIGFLHMLDSLPAPKREAMRGLSEPEQESQFYRWGSDILGHSPGKRALMAWRNFAAMYTLVPSAQYHSSRNRLLYSVIYIPILVFGLIGFFLLRRRWKELSLLWGWILTNTTLYCLYFATIRYRIPTVDPLLMLGFGVSVATVMGRPWDGRGNSGDQE